MIPRVQSFNAGHVYQGVPGTALKAWLVATAAEERLSKLDAVKLNLRWRLSGTRLLFPQLGTFLSNSFVQNA
jgi:hypothetical protein